MITPAPWTLGEATATIPIKSGNKTVASVRYGPTDLDGARLIAAAPDLLAALRDVVFNIEAMGRSRSKLWEAHDRAIEAIAKAEGA